MQQSHLIAWQTHAPWPKRSQIEQDLHKGHLAPAARYSEDIDLVLVKPMNTDALDQRLRRVLTPVLGSPTIR